MVHLTPFVVTTGRCCIRTRLRKGIFFSMGPVVFLAVVLFVDSLYGGQRRGLSIGIDASGPVASFLPDQAFGAGLDGQGGEDLEKIYSPGNIKVMTQAAYRRLAYRLRTELGIEAWHWNENGTWSDEANRQGYWTSSDKSKGSLLMSYGYRLPRRGSTVDQAENRGYSRLDDGDDSTFWKSNPYLDAYFTGIDNARYPQWVIVDLGRRQKVNALRLLWAEPYATRYEVQYWDGMDAEQAKDLVAGAWRSFAGGLILNGKGGKIQLRFGKTPVSVRFVRIQLIASSGTGPETRDVRDRLGYALRELSMGVLDGRGRFQDVIRHGTSSTSQTMIIVSSTDPWHRAIDRNPESVHPGFDRIMASGLGRGNPVLVPISVLYDIPENMAALIRHLRSQGFPMKRIELGEEPDGQDTSPEHYAALYLQFAKIVHEIDPALITGGPSLQSEVDGWKTFAGADGERSWMKRFLGYLRERRRLMDFGFFSFEWYPFDSVCRPASEQLITQPALMTKVLEGLDRDGVPRDIPWIISEYGYSSFAGRAEVELPAALLNAEIVAQFLTLGGRTAYYYGLEPNTPIRELGRCGHPDRLWGNLMMFQQGPDGEARWRLPAYYGGKMLVEEWAEPVNARHLLFRASVSEGEKVPEDVTAYVVRRPDRRWAVMILNKGADTIRLERIRFENKNNEGHDWHGSLEVIQYSPRQYTWRSDSAKGHPIRSEPPHSFHAPNGCVSGILLPSLSLTVVRGDGLQPFDTR